MIRAREIPQLLSATRLTLAKTLADFEINDIAGLQPLFLL
jgi:hypothetical protein